MSLQTIREVTNIPGIDDARVVSEAVAAEFLAMSVDTLRRMCTRGEGPRRIRLSPRKIGFRLRDLHAFVEACAVRAETEAH